MGSVSWCERMRLQATGWVHEPRASSERPEASQPRQRSAARGHGIGIAELIHSRNCLESLKVLLPTFSLLSVLHRRSSRLKQLPDNDAQGASFQAKVPFAVERGGLKPVHPLPLHPASRGARRALPVPRRRQPSSRPRPNAGGLVDADRELRRASNA